MRIPAKDDLTANVVREMLDYDPTTGTLTWKWRKDIQSNLNARYAGRVAGWIHHSGRRMIRINCKNYLSYRLAWLHYYGKWPKDQIDHINLNPSDDRIENLREASNSQNQANSRVQSNNTSGYKGVSRHTCRKWQAQIQMNKKTIPLGRFETPEEAHAAYCAAAKKLHGKFARTA